MTEIGSTVYFNFLQLAMNVLIYIIYIISVMSLLLRVWLYLSEQTSVIKDILIKVGFCNYFGNYVKFF